MSGETVMLQSTASFADSIADAVSGGTYTVAQMIGHGGRKARIPLPLLAAASRLVSSMALGDLCPCSDVVMHLPGFSDDILDLFAIFVRGCHIAVSGEQLKELYELCSVLGVGMGIGSLVHGAVVVEKVVEVNIEEEPQVYSDPSEFVEAVVDSEFECEHCDKSYKTKGSLARHVRQSHQAQLPSNNVSSSVGMDIGKTDCDDGNNNDETSSSYSLGTPEYKCSVCSKSFTAKTSLYRHFNSKHSASQSSISFDENSYLCCYCAKRFHDKELFIRHACPNAGEDRPFHCPYCPHLSKTASHLKQHLPIHATDKQYKCDLCDQSFKAQYHLNRHRKLHSTSSPHVRNVQETHTPAKKNNNKQTKYKARTYASGDRPFACPYCPMRSKTAGNLREHILVHSSEKPFKCHLCDSSFKMKSRLKSHIISAHADSNSAPTESSVYTVKQEELDDKMGTSSQALFENMSVDIPDDQWECSGCFQCFKSQVIYRRHMKHCEKVKDADYTTV